MESSVQVSPVYYQSYGTVFDITTTTLIYTRFWLHNGNNYAYNNVNVVNIR